MKFEIVVNLDVRSFCLYACCICRDNDFENVYISGDNLQMSQVISNVAIQYAERSRRSIIVFCAYLVEFPRYNDASVANRDFLYLTRSALPLDLCIADKHGTIFSSRSASTGLSQSYLNSRLEPRYIAENSKIRHVTAVQGHSKSSKLASYHSTSRMCDFLLVVNSNLAISCTVSEILQQKLQKSLFYTPHLI